jgi:hypothetical protein
MALTKVKLIADGTIVQSHLNASHGITTADIGENASYLYYTDARARAAISVSGNALSYNSSTGVITSNFEENPVFTTGVTVANDSGHFTLFRTDGVTQLGKLYDDSGFTIEGKANNNLILRTKANSLGEGIKFQDTSSNDLMFIDGTNGQVGIGETSPASTLVVRKDNAGGRGGEITILNYATNTIGNEAALNFGLEDSTYAGDVGNAQIKALTTASNAASDIVFSTWNGSSFGERMRINSSGNVGIGEIPSNWSTFTVLQVEKASLASTGGDMNLMSNSYYDGTAYKYIESNAAARQYYNTDGTMHFYNASIGTAGGTVTWNERMRIDSSGNVMMGKNSQSGNAALTVKSMAGGNTGLILIEGDTTNDGHGLYATTDNKFVITRFTNGSYSDNFVMDSSGNVGINKTTALGGHALSIKKVSNQQLGLYYDETNFAAFGSRSNGDVQIYGWDGSSLKNILLGVDGSATGGKVGIGTISPSATLHVATAGGIKLFNDGVYGYISIGSSGLTGQYPYLRVDSFRSDGSGYFWALGHERADGTKSIKMLMNDGTSDQVTIINSLAISRFTANEFNSSYPSFSTGALIRSHDTSYFNGGNVGIGTTSPGYMLHVQSNSSSTSAAFFRPNVIGSGDPAEPTTVYIDGQKAAALDINRFYSHGTILNIRQNNSNVGSISVTGVATSYNTSSDYRLKENVVEMTGALDRVSQLKPSRFNFIADANTTVDGFLAHEVQDIVPEAITGAKDEVDVEGNPVYQGIDQSKLVPLLVGAIKELKADNDSLRARIEILENN